MKKLSLVLIILLGIIIIPVHAANYKLKELIPENIETTIVTDLFSYKDFYYKDGVINFKGIKNISTEARPMTFYIALFNSKKENIGSVNFCTTQESDGKLIGQSTLASKEEKSLSLKITKDYLIDGEKVKNIKYIAMISDNRNCNTIRPNEYAGQTMEEMGRFKNNRMDSRAELLLKLVRIGVGLLILYFVYLYLFTNRFKNVDGEDLRIGYNNYNKELERERQEELRKHPPKPKEVIKTKTDEVLQQEEKEANSSRDSSELHDFFK